jgi:glycosyltransferase involved in cell wall biosynthesis
VRIGVNCCPLRADKGGLKQYFYALMKQLLERDPENAYVLFWEEANRQELANLPSGRWEGRAIQVRGPRAIAAHSDRFDLLFCPFGVLEPRPLPKPAVVTLADIQEVFYPDFFTAEERFSRDLNFRASTRIADRVVTISEFSKKTIVRHHGLAAEKVVVAYPSPDERFHRAEDVARPPRQPLPSEFVFYPANSWRHKNHQVLLEALVILKREQGRALNVVLTGYVDPKGFPLAAQVEELGLRGHVQHLGYVTTGELAFLYRRARLLVFPSLFEGFGIPLVEAMAAGCPVVAANRTSLPEIAGEAARLFDPTSPRELARVIRQLWDEPGERDRLIRRGRERVRAFSAEATAGQHRLAFAEASHGFRYGRYLWNRWVFNGYHRLRTEVRWHGARRRGRSERDRASAA